MSFFDDETLKLIRWWEDELTSEDRRRLMGDYSWKGPTEERHKKLKEMHSNFINSKSKRIP